MISTDETYLGMMLRCLLLELMLFYLFSAYSIDFFKIVVYSYFNIKFTWASKRY